jgi:hypothetical protein
MTDTAIAPAKRKLILDRFKCRELANGNILTSPARLSYCYLIKPQEAKPRKDGSVSKPTWKTSLLFPKGADLSVIQSAAEGCALEVFGSKWRAKKLNMPLRDQGTQTVTDEHGNESVKEGYTAGAMFLNANSYRKPGAVYSDGITPVEDEDVFYPGAWVIASIRADDYQTDENNGIKFWLQNVMFLADDLRIGGSGGGGSKAEDDFAGLGLPDDLDSMFDQPSEDEFA